MTAGLLLLAALGFHSVDAVGPSHHLSRRSRIKLAHNRDWKWLRRLYRRASARRGAPKR
ncbi:MAG: hypothetical protein J7M25_02160 [Deltaproteobacteria bacterium]|nr:hypothetical protein [Deltaproteobacteria bacterium]